VNAATSFNYTVTVTNHGPSTAASVVITDTLPANATFVSASGGGGARLGRRTWSTIAHARERRERLVHRHQDGAGDRTMENVAAATTSTTDPDPATTTARTRATGSRPRSASSRPVVTKTDGQRRGRDGLELHGRRRNQGPSTAASVVLRDTLPAGVTSLGQRRSTESGGVVTWPTMRAWQTAPSPRTPSPVTAPHTGNARERGLATTSTPDPSRGNSEGSDPSSRVTTT